MNARTTTLEPVSRPDAVTLIPVHYETARSIIAALADDFSQKIVTCAVDQGMTIEDISLTRGIPLSTCYRRVRELVDSGLLLIEKIVVTGSGKRFAMYRSCFRSFEVSFGLQGLSVQAELNKDVAEKLRTRNITMGAVRQSSRDAMNNPLSGGPGLVLNQGKRA